MIITQADLDGRRGGRGGAHEVFYRDRPTCTDSESAWHTLVATGDGNVWGFGRNDVGPIGDGTTACRSTPVQVTGLSGIVAVAGSEWHSLALKSDGTVWAWGTDREGELGNGQTSTKASPTPAQVLGPGGAGYLTGVKAAAGGAAHSLALKADGTAYAWGRDREGQVGDGTTSTSPRTSPVPVAGLAGQGAVVAAWWGSWARVPATASAPTTTTTTYGYDQLYRLTSVNNGATTYSYDPVGNRLSKVLGGTTTSYSYDYADRLLAVSGQTYTVDANGNLTSFPSNALADDQANRLKTATIGGTTTTYAYDGDRKRASKIVGSTTTGYVYDANRALPDVLTDGSLKYVWGQGLAYATDTSGNVQGVYHPDGLGSVRAVTDASGNVIQAYTADEFGVPTQTQGTSAQPFGYTGEPQDAESGFVFLRARYYDPALGRFLTRDAFAGSVADPLSLNRYSYAENSPTNLMDPSGHCLEDGCVMESYLLYELFGQSIAATGAEAAFQAGIYRVMQDSYALHRMIDDENTMLVVATMIVGGEIGLIEEATDIGTGNGLFYAKRSYGTWIDKQPRVRSKGGRPRWAVQGGFVEWDPSHGGELEWYDRQGRHKGVLDPDTGKQIKPAVPGRTATP